jgi:hypothetical protein
VAAHIILCLIKAVAGLTDMFIAGIKAANIKEPPSFAPAKNPGFICALRENLRPVQ